MTGRLYLSTLTVFEVVDCGWQIVPKYEYSLLSGIFKLRPKMFTISSPFSRAYSTSYEVASFGYRFPASSLIIFIIITKH